MSIYGDPATVGGSGGEIIYTPESLDKFEKIVLDNNLTPYYWSTVNDNSNIHLAYLGKSLMFHISGSFSNSSTCQLGLFLSKEISEGLVGKYLNFKISGTRSDGVSVQGNIQASTPPWKNQASTNESTKKCVISQMPEGSYDVYYFCAVRGSAGLSIDVYVELTITDD